MEQGEIPADPRTRLASRDRARALLDITYRNNSQHLTDLLSVQRFAGLMNKTAVGSLIVMHLVSYLP